MSPLLMLKEITSVKGSVIVRKIIGRLAFTAFEIYSQKEEMFAQQSLTKII